MTKPKYMLISNSELQSSVIQNLVINNPNIHYLGNFPFVDGLDPMLNLIEDKEADVILVNSALDKLRKDELKDKLKNKSVTLLFSSFQNDTESMPDLLNELPSELVNPAIKLSDDLYLLRLFLDEHYDQESGKSLDFIFVKSNKRMVKLRIKDIAFIEAMADYIKINMDNGTRLITQKTMSKILELLPSNRFIRINRSFIVNGHKIDSFSSSNVYINENAIPIGKSYKDSFKKLIRSI